MNERDVRALAVGGVVLLTVCGALCGVLESLLVPLYAGSTQLPVAIVLAIASNIALPRLARNLLPTTAAAAAPFVAWLLVVVLFGVLARPEGDVILPGGSLQWITYAMVLGGSVAGVASVMLGGLPARARQPLPRAADPTD